MPIRIFNNTIWKTEIDTFTSLSWTRRWHKPGAFQLHMNRHLYGASELQKGNLVLFSDLAGLIRHREIGLDKTGKLSENWDIRGPDMAGITAQRITVPPVGQAYDVITGPVETVMKQLVDHNLINPANPVRAVANLVVATDQGRGQEVTWRSRYKQLDEELQALSLLSGLGWGVEFDPATGAMTFEVYEGRDLTVGQNVLPPVIFSPDFDNIKIQGYRNSLLNLRNMVYVGGQGEGELRTIVEVSNGTPSGVDRYEMFTDGRDTDDTGELTTRGQEALTERGEEFFFEADIITPVQRMAYDKTYYYLSPTQVAEETKQRVYYTSGTFKYGIDYDLGDIVTIQNRDWGVTMNARIVEITITQEQGQPEQISAVFGTSWPTLIDQLKKELKQTEVVVRG